MNDDKKMTLSDVIKEIRQENGLTQEEMGNIIGVKKSAVQKYEDGTIKNLKLNTIRTICETFSIAPWKIVFPEKNEDWLLNLEYEKSNKEEVIEIAIKKVFNENYVYVFRSYMQLNHNGREKIKEYINDLLEIEKYRNTNNS